MTGTTVQHGGKFYSWPRARDLHADQLEEIQKIDDALNFLQHKKDALQEQLANFDAWTKQNEGLLYRYNNRQVIMHVEDLPFQSMGEERRKKMMGAVSDFSFIETKSPTVRNLLPCS